MADIFTRAAEAAHEANRVLCLALGDSSQQKWKDAPQWQKDSAIVGVRLINNNPETKEHPCFRPYSELPEGQRLKDEMFGIVVRSVLGISLEVSNG